MFTGGGRGDGGGSQVAGVIRPHVSGEHTHPDVGM